MEATNYIDWEQICADHNLKSGDITPHQTMVLEKTIIDFIKQNT